MFDTAIGKNCGAYSLVAGRGILNDNNRHMLCKLANPGD